MPTRESHKREKQDIVKDAETGEMVSIQRDSAMNYVAMDISFG